MYIFCIRLLRTCARYGDHMCQSGRLAEVEEPRRALECKVLERTHLSHGLKRPVRIHILYIHHKIYIESSMHFFHIGFNFLRVLIRIPKPTTTSKSACVRKFLDGRASSNFNTSHTCLDCACVRAFRWSNRCVFVVIVYVT